MKAYATLEKAWNNKDPIPRMYNKINTKHQQYDYSQNWSQKFEDTEIWTEQVIGYYSRCFRGPETRYSATEREALAAKEGLVRFQPFIEGEDIMLITDHATLQWVKTYENSNH